MQRYSKAIIITLTSLYLIATASIAILIAHRPVEAPAVSEAMVQTSGPPTVDELFELVNEERAKVGVAPLKMDERLNQSAQQKADDMNKNDYFGHIDKNGHHGYDIAREKAPDICAYPSENISWGVIENTSESAMTGWKQSKPHYQAMINSSYSYTGFGISGNKIAEHFC